LPPLTIVVVAAFVVVAVGSGSGRGFATHALSHAVPIGLSFSYFPFQPLLVLDEPEG
jgi:hypothetical protein